MTEAPAAVVIEQRGEEDNGGDSFSADDVGEGPDRWYAFYSEKHRREYYYHPKHRISTWITPETYRPSEEDVFEAGVRADFAGGEKETISSGTKTAPQSVLEGKLEGLSGGRDQRRRADLLSSTRVGFARGGGGLDEKSGCKSRSLGLNTEDDGFGSKSILRRKVVIAIAAALLIILAVGGGTYWYVSGRAVRSDAPPVAVQTSSSLASEEISLDDRGTVHAIERQEVSALQGIDGTETVASGVGSSSASVTEGLEMSPDTDSGETVSRIEPPLRRTDGWVKSVRGSMSQAGGEGKGDAQPHTSSDWPSTSNALDHNAAEDGHAHIRRAPPGKKSRPGSEVEEDGGDGSVSKGRDGAIYDVNERSSGDESTNEVTASSGTIPPLNDHLKGHYPNVVPSAGETHQDSTREGINDSEYIDDDAQNTNGQLMVDITRSAQQSIETVLEVNSGGAERDQTGEQQQRGRIGQVPLHSSKSQQMKDAKSPQDDEEDPDFRSKLNNNNPAEAHVAASAVHSWSENSAVLRLVAEGMTPPVWPMGFRATTGKTDKGGASRLDQSNLNDTVSAGTLTAHAPSSRGNTVRTPIKCFMPLSYIAFAFCRRRVQSEVPLFDAERMVESMLE